MLDNFICSLLDEKKSRREMRIFPIYANKQCFYYLREEKRRREHGYFLKREIKFDLMLLRAML